MTDTAAVPPHHASGPDLGQPAPAFNLPATGSHTAHLADCMGRKVVVYFYPKDDTSGCTAQARAFADHFAAFERAGVTLIGISKDSMASHESFKTKYDLPFTLASDKDGDVVERYGVWVEKSMYGRRYMGIERATFLIDEQGIVRGVWRKVKVPGHAEAVLKAVQAL
jgi:thioredoxin-dependent peroxiredoxin